MITKIKRKLYEWLKKDFETPEDTLLSFRHEGLDFYKIESRAIDIPRDTLFGEDMFLKQYEKHFLEEVCKDIEVQSLGGFGGRREIYLSLYIGKKKENKKKSVSCGNPQVNYLNGT